MVDTIFKLRRKTLPSTLGLLLVVEVGVARLAAVVAVVVLRHEGVRAGGRRVLAQPRDLAVVLDLVEAEHAELVLLADVLGLLGLGVGLLLALLAAAAQPQHEVQRRLLLPM